MPQAQATPEQVQQSLGVILQDPRFRSSPQMSAFLAYIVEQTLEGKAERIKAYTIAVDALGKPVTFDPQTNPSVRVLAKRLRDTLGQYYESANDDSLGVRICLNPGSYVPTFEDCANDSNLPAAIPAERETGTTGQSGSRLVETLKYGYLNYHRQATLTGLLVMALGVWHMSPSTRHETADESVTNPAEVVQTAEVMMPIDIASLEHINPMLERPQIPALNIHSESVHLQAKHRLMQYLGEYTHVILHDLTETETGEVEPWPESYTLAIRDKDSSHVEVSVMHTRSGVELQHLLLPVGNNGAGIDEDYSQFSRSLLQSGGALLSDYQRRGELTPTMRCAFLFDDYYANKTRTNRKAAEACAYKLQISGTIDQSPGLF